MESRTKRPARVGALTEAAMRAGVTVPAAATQIRDEADVRRLKWRFVEVARQVCPGWQVTAEQTAAVNAVFCWCCELPGPLDPQRGLLLSGPVGSGKSTLLEVVRRFAPEVRSSPTGGAYRFRITPAIEVAAAFNSGGYHAIDEYCTSCYQAFDDLGCEPMRVNYYGTAVNVMEHVLLARYGRWNDFTHLTTNLDLDDICSWYGERVADRCREMFNFVKVLGASWRDRDR